MNLTRADLGSICGVSESHIRSLESCKRSPSNALAHRLAMTLKIYQGELQLPEPEREEAAA